MTLDLDKVSQCSLLECHVFFPLSLLSQGIHFYFSFHCGNFPFVVNEFKVHCPTFLSIGKKILFILLIRISPESRLGPGPRQAQ